MIYVVEDDPGIRKLLLIALKANGYESEGFESSSELYKKVYNENVDLILLDIMLPGQSGLEILSTLKSKEKTANIPVIMVTAKDSEYDKVLGLESGADDYIAKPFSTLELLSRVKAVLRRTKKDEKSSLSVSGITMDINAHSVKAGDEEIGLSYKEFELLRILMENAGNVLSREVLLDRVWGYSPDSETRTVDVHIRHLREKLGSFGDRIETIKGIGYKMQGTL